ncbi:MAG: multicopper oxidase domain-containing protein [Flavobacteriales bacterium]|nr:MAG: multicopper oxidase domain-containing protein [Flavobacteriales bacterium]
MRQLAIACLLFPALVLGQGMQPMAVPPVLMLDTFHLVVDEHAHQFYPGITTSTYGASAEYLGPTLILQQGDTARIAIHNQLAQVTSMHWHGMHVPGEMDGGPQRIIAPGESWMAEFPVKNPAATYWYHPHPHELTAEQANFGVAGFIIVRDEEEAQLALPRAYGVDDFPVVIQDRKFLANGDFAFYPFGDSVLVNGTPNAYLECPAQVVRLRLLNGSNARIYALGFDDGRPFQVIAGDGGLLPAPEVTDRLWLSNGERAEVLLDLTGLEGDSLLLMSYGNELPSTVPGSGNMVWESSILNGVAFPVLRIRVTAPTPDPVTVVPATLVAHPVPDEATSIRTRTKTLTGMGMVGMGMFMINGLMFDLDVVNDTMQLGSTEVWHIVNNSNMAHPMHIHGVSFFILERNGQPPAPWDRGPKDVVLVDRFEDVKLIMRFGEATEGWPFMYHCHNLLHEDNMMMLQFIVVDPSMGLDADHLPRAMVAPMPTLGAVHYRADHPVERIIVRDATGRVLLTQPGSWAMEGMVDLSAMPAGMLWMELVGAKHRSRARVIKQ